MKKKMSLKVILAALTILCVVMLAACDSTARALKEYESKVESQLEECRSSGGTYFNSSSFDLEIPDELIDNPELGTFLVEQVKTMCEQNEFSLLAGFLGALEEEEIYIRDIQNALNEEMNSVTDLEALFDAYDSFSSLSLYSLSLTKDSPVITNYFDKNDVEETTTIKGKGYYGNKENTSSDHVIGVEGSGLHDAEINQYFGDFYVHNEYGASLNEYYEEESYESFDYYFRDVKIPFNPIKQECVLSGDYLFAFSPDGSLSYAMKIDRSAVAYEGDGENSEIISIGGIEWLVLDSNENGSLLITKDCLETRPFNEKDEDVTWDGCTLRTYLNGTWYDATFSEEEKAHIKTTKVSAVTSTGRGSETEDKIFLLSVDEADKYFASDGDRIGVYDRNAAEWWLSTPALRFNGATYVDKTGKVQQYGGRNVNVNSGGIYVRPAMWVDAGIAE